MQIMMKNPLNYNCDTVYMGGTGWEYKTLVILKHNNAEEEIFPLRPEGGPTKKNVLGKGFVYQASTYIT